MTTRAHLGKGATEAGEGRRRNGLITHAAGITVNRLGVNQMIAHVGTVKQAIRVLRWWAEDASDEPDVLEAIKQSREAARDLVASLRRHERRKAR